MHIEVGSRVVLRYFTMNGLTPSTIWIVDRLVADMYPDPRLDELVLHVHDEGMPRRKMQDVWYHFSSYEHMDRAEELAS